MTEKPHRPILSLKKPVTGITSRGPLFDLPNRIKLEETHLLQDSEMLLVQRMLLAEAERIQPHYPQAAEVVRYLASHELNNKEQSFTIQSIRMAADQEVHFNRQAGVTLDDENQRLFAGCVDKVLNQFIGRKCDVTGRVVGEHSSGQLSR